ncbi:MAG: hypothetical protein G01um101433_992, partial [Parcubacteria group bacterium Gr01-1014_33]
PEIIPNDFAKKYPHIADWVADGVIEIGRQEWGHSFISVYDQGSTVWEGKRTYATINEALEDGGTCDQQMAQRERIKRIYFFIKRHKKLDSENCEILHFSETKRVDKGDLRLYNDLSKL